MWYVEKFLVPALGDVEVWNDDKKAGNLRACMESFAARNGDATWHLQDDVFPCKDFLQRAEEYDGVVYGFCCEQFGDDAEKVGKVYAPDCWHSFQCVRIPDSYANECAEWYFSGEWEKNPSLELHALHAANMGDDTFFREFLQEKHGREKVTNAAPNLVEHVDWLVGGSTLSPWRGYLARSAHWDDEESIKELKAQIKALSL